MNFKIALLLALYSSLSLAVAPKNAQINSEKKSVAEEKTQISYKALLKDCANLGAGALLIGCSVFCALRVKRASVIENIMNECWLSEDFNKEAWAHTESAYDHVDLSNTSYHAKMALLASLSIASGTLGGRLLWQSVKAITKRLNS